MNIYYDAEFTGLHRNTTLISIGMVTERGAYFYAEFTDYDKNQVNDWLQENVIDRLVLEETPKVMNVLNKISGSKSKLVRGKRDLIGHELMIWLEDQAGINNPDEENDIIHFYTDYYAYDWVLLNDLICKDGQALNLPGFINYIPIDLSTALAMDGYDPDITREEFVYPDDLRMLRSLSQFEKWGENCKHNSLWDAYVCMKCFYRLSHKNHRVYSEESVRTAIEKCKLDPHIFVGEKDHPKENK